MERITRIPEAVATLVWRKFPGLDKDDLLGAANYGYCLALQKFRQDGGMKLENFAYQWAWAYAWKEAKDLSRWNCEALPDSWDPPSHANTCEEALASLQVAEIREAMLRLRPSHQNVLELFFFQGWTLEEIAKSQGVTRANVHIMKNRALQALWVLLGVEHD